MKRIEEQNIKKQKPQNIVFNEELSEKEKERLVIYEQYFENLATWHEYAKEFMKSPYVVRFCDLDVRNLSDEQKTYIVSDNKTMDNLYEIAHYLMYVKHHFDSKKVNCSAYAGFVSTFAKLLNPQNDVVVYFGSVINTKSLSEKENDNRTEHFWVTINGKLFDNSKIDGFSYTDYKTVLETKDILSGNFSVE